MGDDQDERPEGAPDFLPPEEPRDAEPDYSSYGDQDLASAARDYHDPDALRRDILPDDYRQPTFASRFGDAYRANRQALADGERGAQNSETPPQDLASRERAGGNRYDAARKHAANQAAWIFENLDHKRAEAQLASKDKQNSFLSRNKSKVVGWAIGLILSGGIMAVLSLPAMAIAQFGAAANFLKAATQGVHDLAVGARSFADTVRSATVAAKEAARAAASGVARDYFQRSRVGMFGAMVGQNYLKQLSEAGFTVKTDILGRFDGIDIDLNQLMGTTNYQMLDESHFAEGSPERARAEAQNARTRTRFESDIAARYPSLAGQVDVSPDGRTLSTRPGFKPNRRQMLDLSGAAGDVAGVNKTALGRVVKTRYVARMVGIFSKFNPIENLKGKALDEIRKWYRDRKAQDSGKADNTAPKDAARDSDGNTTDMGEPELRDIENGGKGTEPPKVGKGAKFKAGLKGGLAAVLLIGLCAINSAKDNFLQNAMSLMTTMAGQYQQVVSQWEQIKAAFIGLDGGQINMDVLAVLSGDFYQDHIPDANYDVDEDGNIVTNADTTYVSRSWTGAPAYQAKVNGRLVSTDRVPQEEVHAYEENGGWAAQVGLFISQIPVLGTIIGVTGDVLCSPVAGWVMDILGSLNPVGLISTAIMHIPAVSDKIGELIAWAFQIGAGVVLYLANLDPDQLMETAYRGGEYKAITSFGSMGAGVVTVSQAYENQLFADEYADREWRAKPLLARLFDATDYRSAIARLTAEAGLNPVPTTAKQYFANFARLVGAVPSFVVGGLFNGRSLQASAATSVAYDTGAPHIEFTPEFLDKISGGDDSYDYDENAARAFDLLDAPGSDKRDYAQTCLGLTIGPAPDYTVSAFETTDPSKALLVGLAGTWKYQNQNCADLATKDDYQRVALYAGLDYQILAGYAWYSAPDSDPETQKIYKEIFGGAADAASDTPSGNAQQLAQAIVASGKVTHLVPSETAPQIQSYADTGHPYQGPDGPCHIDTFILDMINKIIQTHTIMISDINRTCIGTANDYASGMSSYHSRDGGGHAIDIAMVDGVAVTGRDARSVNLLNEIILPMLPTDSGVGQTQCASDGTVNLPAGIRTFNDDCSHLHVEVGQTGWNSE